MNSKLINKLEARCDEIDSITLPILAEYRELRLRVEQLSYKLGPLLREKNDLQVELFEEQNKIEQVPYYGPRKSVKKTTKPMTKEEFRVLFDKLSSAEQKKILGAK